MTTTVAVTIRPFSAADYEAVVALYNQAFPEYPETVSDWQHYDTTREAHLNFGRFVAEADGQIVGFVQHDQHSGRYHPQKFYVNGAVAAEQRGQGIGAALYDHLLAALAPIKPLAFRVQAREDMPHALSFLAKRNFVEDMRTWESRLDVPSFDFVPYADVPAETERHGIRIVPISALQDDPEHRRKLYELDREVINDVPSPEERTPITLEQFVKHVFDDPNFLPDACFVAVDGDEFVGMTELFKNTEQPDLYTGLTAVKRSHRRRNIALALKLRAIEYARAAGSPTIKTWNASNNRPMLAINERLGFVRQPAWLDLAVNFEQD